MKFPKSREIFVYFFGKLIPYFPRCHGIASKSLLFVEILFEIPVVVVVGPTTAAYLLLLFILVFPPICVGRLSEANGISILQIKMSLKTLLLLQKRKVEK